MDFMALTSIERLKVAFDAIFEGSNIVAAIAGAGTSVDVYKNTVHVCTVEYWPFGFGDSGNCFQLLAYFGDTVFDTEHRYRYEVFLAALSAIDNHR